MKFERFEDIVAWQKARILTMNIYAAFSKCKDYSFCDQIQRAAVSVMNNIAEGYERKSNNEFKHFLFMSKGSCGEVRSMLYAALDLKKITEDDFTALFPLTIEISKIISGLIKSL
jgi:four helix bundle protein